ncbi:hypothetical protein DFH09DRAFT_132230 [Mycena vulgaris]|nr:hypothetical protein DFH09DRAFT_132230 [Mycena vulgaris]
MRFSPTAITFIVSIPSLFFPVLKYPTQAGLTPWRATSGRIPRMPTRRHASYEIDPYWAINTTFIGENAVVLPKIEHSRVCLNPHYIPSTKLRVPAPSSSPEALPGHETTVPPPTRLLLPEQPPLEFPVPALPSSPETLPAHENTAPALLPEQPAQSIELSAPPSSPEAISPQETTATPPAGLSFPEEPAAFLIVARAISRVPSADT